MRALVCFLHFGVAGIAIAGWGRLSSAEGLSGMEIYEFSGWVSCLDRDNVTCENKSGTHASYNPLTGKCEVLVGTDCGGGENHFTNMTECNKTCNDAPKPPCSLEMKDGPGRALHRRWYFNTSTAECQPFLYGGMLGNANNFENLKECQGNCSGFSLFKKVNVSIDGSLSSVPSS
uniref:Putative secreted protein n=1 Tax=Ixodes scapularis TaxID=6945 RepID=Q8MVB5_IXOSC|nr:putative secreted protein [Ixodes scapularis]